MRQIIFKDENKFNKELKALRKYCVIAAKYLFFEVIKYDLFEKKDGSYELELPISEEFKIIYGKIKLKYSICNDKIIFEDLEPKDFFISGYKIELDSHKGMFYRDEKDIFKINLVMKMKEGKI